MSGRRAPRLRRPARAALAVGGVLALCAAAAALTPAFAASLGITAGRLTGWQSATSAACAAPGTQNLSASADTYVSRASLTGNFGTATTMNVSADTGTARARTLVKFTLPTKPSGCTVTSATLRLNATAASSGTRTLQAWRAATTWTETGVTWNTVPATLGTAVTTTSATGNRTWTVTTHVQQLYLGNGDGFIVTDSSEATGTAQAQTFRSRENASNQPNLAVTFG